MVSEVNIWVFGIQLLLIHFKLLLIGEAKPVGSDKLLWAWKQ